MFVRMRTFTISLILASLVATSTALNCWDTNGNFYPMKATNTIQMKKCGNDAKSCMKEWYKASPVKTSGIM